MKIWSSNVPSDTTGGFSPHRCTSIYYFGYGCDFAVVVVKLQSISDSPSWMIIDVPTPKLNILVKIL
jgi:hypothetical protein